MKKIDDDKLNSISQGKYCVDNKVDKNIEKKLLSLGTKNSYHLFPEPRVTGNFYNSDSDTTLFPKIAFPKKIFSFSNKKKFYSSIFFYKMSYHFIADFIKYEQQYFVYFISFLFFYAESMQIQMLSKSTGK